MYNYVTTSKNEEIVLIANGRIIAHLLFREGYEKAFSHLVRFDRKSSTIIDIISIRLLSMTLVRKFEERIQRTGYLIYNILGSSAMGIEKLMSFASHFKDPLPHYSLHQLVTGIELAFLPLQNIKSLYISGLRLTRENNGRNFWLKTAKKAPPFIHYVILLQI